MTLSISRCNMLHNRACWFSFLLSYLQEFHLTDGMPSPRSLRIEKTDEPGVFRLVKS